MIAQLLPIITELLALAATAAIEGPKLLKMAEKIWATLVDKEAPTDAQIAAYLAAHEKAHKAVQDL